MKIYLLSPEITPNPHLFPMFVPHWEELGSKVVDRIQDADVVFCDLHTRIAGYNERDFEWMIKHEPKAVSFCEWDRGGMSKERWPNPLTEQQRMMKFDVHFWRTLEKEPYWTHLKVYPYEKPILHEETVVDENELFNREYDVVWIANTSPQREQIAKALRLESKLKCKIILGGKKMPYQDWLNEHRKGKLFVSCGGGGITDERAQHLFSIAGQIREVTGHYQLHPFTHSINCISITSDPFPAKDELDFIRYVCSHKNELHSIYQNGWFHMKQFYTSKYIAFDILNKVKRLLA
jgi:hypothetical protein